MLLLVLNILHYLQRIVIVPKPIAFDTVISALSIHVLLMQESCVFSADYAFATTKRNFCLLHQFGARRNFCMNAW